jgi:hypothetical protein
VSWFFKKLDRKPWKNQVKKSVTYDLMHLHLLFSTVKTAALYLVSIKSYTKGTFLNTFVVGRFNHPQEQFDKHEKIQPYHLEEKDSISHHREA